VFGGAKLNRVAVGPTSVQRILMPMILYALTSEYGKNESAVVVSQDALADRFVPPKCIGRSLIVDESRPPCERSPRSRLGPLMRCFCCRRPHPPRRLVTVTYYQIDFSTFPNAVGQTALRCWDQSR